MHWDDLHNSNSETLQDKIDAKAAQPKSAYCDSQFNPNNNEKSKLPKNKLPNKATHLLPQAYQLTLHKSQSDIMVKTKQTQVNPQTPPL